MSVEIPHFSMPFRFAGVPAAAVVVEQDSSAEIADCVAACCRTIIGQRVEEPGFGISDPTFQQGDRIVAELLAEIEPWEPRARIAIVEGDPLVSAVIDLTIASSPGG